MWNLSWPKSTWGTDEFSRGEGFCLRWCNKKIFTLPEHYKFTFVSFYQNFVVEHLPHSYINISFWWLTWVTDVADDWSRILINKRWLLHRVLDSTSSFRDPTKSRPCTPSTSLSSRLLVRDKVRQCGRPLFLYNNCSLPRSTSFEL